MLYIFARTSNDVRYFTQDPAHELDGLRDGPAGWWIRGEGELEDPTRVAQVFGGSSRSRTVGYDLIFSAPRMVSALLAIDEAAGHSVVASHRASVRSAMEYLENYALGVRQRVEDEVEVVPARWREIVAYTHGVNRLGEPHLHDHVLVGAAPAHRNRALDSRGLFAHLRAADSLYRSELRWRVGDSTTYVPWRSFGGNEMIVGVDDGYRTLWSGRSSRPLEKRLWLREEITARWAKDRERFTPFGERATPTLFPDVVDEHAFAAQLSQRSSVYRRTLVEAWANAARYGQSAQSVNEVVELLSAGRARGIGVQENELVRSDLLQLARVREFGPRPLRAQNLSHWLESPVTTESRVIETGRQFDPSRLLRRREPERVPGAPGRDLGDRQARTLVP